MRSVNLRVVTSKRNGSMLLSWSLLWLAALVFTGPSRLARASVGGSISGVVKDQSGAVVPGVTVIATNTLTGIKQKAVTDAQGFYAFPALSVGRYEIDVQQSGFKHLRQTGLVINVNTALRVDATLQVGTSTQEVEVSSTAVHVETTSTQMGEVITGTRMTTVPLNGRSYTDLLALQPGVVPVNSGEYSSPSPSGNLNPGNLSISGGREDSNGFMVNGGNVEEGTANGTAIIPDLDSIAEFRILTNNFDAQYGNYSGGLVNVATKSGTNQFHGDAFEFLRNDSLDSRNFYSPSRGAFHQNQFGGTFGGPIRHDKAFFFIDYQGTRQVVGVDTGLIPVPSLADRTGNLADVSSSLTGSVVGSAFASSLQQKLGYPVLAGEPFYTSGCTASAQCVFPNAVIPQSVWSSPAAPLMKYIPTPNVPGNFFSTSAFNQTLGDDKGSIRVDGNSRLGMLSAYYFLDNSNLLNPYPNANVPGFAASFIGRAQQLILSDTKTFGSSTVNELHLNYVRYANFNNDPVGGVGPSLSSLGFVTGANTPGIVPLNTKFEGVPTISFNNYTMGVDPWASHQDDITYQMADDLAKVYGTHSLKFGGEFHYMQINEIQQEGNNGVFGFNGAQTGLDFADFLLGAPNSFQQGVQAPMNTRTRYGGLYGQDSWRARSNLTLNYGLRWEVSMPWYEQHNQIETMVPGEQSVVFPGAPKGWLVPGDPGIPSTTSPTRYDNFAPRVGFAYSPRGDSGIAGQLFGAGKTSIRAGWGMFYTAYGDASTFNAVGDAPYGLFYVNPVPSQFAAPFLNLGNGQSQGQRFPVPIPPDNVSAANPDRNINWAQYEPISSSPGYLHTNQVPTTEDYMFSIERQFGNDTLLSLSYVGTQGHWLMADLEANPGNPALCLGVSQQSEVMPGTTPCGPFGENGVYYPVTGGVINSTRGPLGPNFGSNGYFATMANSNYNALEVTFRHTAGRASWLASYTYSKSLDNASGWGAGQDVINPINHNLTKGLSSFDMTHDFVASYSYEMPFDKLFGANRATRGWIISGITRFSTGLPVFINDPCDCSLLGVFGTGPGGILDAPNFTPGPLNFTDPRKGNPGTLKNPYFNTSLFSAPAIGQLGTSSQRFFHGPGINNWDMALLKNLRLTESKTLEFRAEFFNAFNHAQFLNPNGNFLSSDFGFVTGARDPRIGQLAIKFLF